MTFDESSKGLGGTDQSLQNKTKHKSSAVGKKYHVITEIYFALHLCFQPPYNKQIISFEFFLLSENINNKLHYNNGVSLKLPLILFTKSNNEGQGLGDMIKKNSNKPRRNQSKANVHYLKACSFTIFLSRLLQYCQRHLLPPVPYIKMFL